MKVNLFIFRYSGFALGSYISLIFQRKERYEKKEIERETEREI